MRRPIAALLLALCGDAAASADPCPPPLDAAGVIRCALEHSLDVRIARDELRALTGRRVAAGVLLPANPTVGFTALARLAPKDAGGSTYFNWTATLSQEIEIAGQRGARIAAVDAEAAAQKRRIAVAELEVAAAALVSYFDLVASQEALSLAAEVSKVAEALGAVAAARAKQQLISPVDADLARGETVRSDLVRIEAERRQAVALATLSALLGRDTAEVMDVAGTLDAAGLAPDAALPLDALIARAFSLRGEIAAAEMERVVAQRRVSLLRRERAPNLTFSVFAQRDGFNEQVYGGGLLLPIPLPAPLGRTHAGEIVEAGARSDQALVVVEKLRRRVRLEVTRAFQDEQARAAAVRAFTPDLLSRWRSDLTVLGDGLAAGQLSVREALLTQRSLIELLQAALDARLDLALARVELRRAAGLPLLGAKP